MKEKNIICCYDSTEVELCGHPSIHIPKLLMVKYFLKNHSLTLLSHLASLFIKVADKTTKCNASLGKIFQG